MKAFRKNNYILNDYKIQNNVYINIRITKEQGKCKNKKNN